MKCKKITLSILTLSISILMSIPTFASGWTKGINRDSWWYDLGNGNYYKNSWQWIDGNSDGIAECYLFDNEGWLYVNTKTPDSYDVNTNGAWIINGVVQTKSVSLPPSDHTAKKAVENKAQKEADNRMYSYKEDVIHLVNEERRKQGLNELSTHSTLAKIADIRATEITEKFSHTRPNNESFSSIYSQYNLSGTAQGENIAAFQENPKDVMNSWMNSSGHKSNILDVNYKYIAVGIAIKNGYFYWVQNFYSE